MGAHSIRFRNYTAADLDACGNIAREVWPMSPAIAIGLRTDMMVRNWIGSVVASSSWAELAEDEHGVFGMLFGNVKGQPAFGTHHSPIVMEMRMVLSLVFGSYGSFARMFRLMASFMMTELKLLLYMPQTDAEITMLVVEGAHRGKGIGKKFVQRFIDAAKSQGARSISLYTDDQTSNWGFYEAFGFKQVKKFYDNGTSRYSGKHAIGMIYRIDLS